MLSTSDLSVMLASRIVVFINRDIHTILFQVGEHEIECQPGFR